MSQENDARLIEQYREAVRARARLRRTLVTTAFAAFFVFGMLIWKSGKNFANSGMVSVNRGLSEHLTANSDRYADSLAQAAGGVFTAYRKAAVKQIHTDLPKVEAITHKELTALNAYTQKRWKDFEKEIVAMALDQETIVREELAKVTTEDRAKQIAESYGQEMDSRIKGFLRAEFGEHLRVGEEIAHNLNRITELEPDLEQPLSVNHAIGLTLELAGLEFQSFDKD